MGLDDPVILEPDNVADMEADNSGEIVRRTGGSVPTHTFSYWLCFLGAVGGGESGNGGGGGGEIGGGKSSLPSIESRSQLSPTSSSKMLSCTFLLKIGDSE